MIKKGLSPKILNFTFSNGIISGTLRDSPRDKTCVFRALLVDYKLLSFIKIGQETKKLHSQKIFGEKVLHFEKKIKNIKKSHPTKQPYSFSMKPHKLSKKPKIELKFCVGATSQ